MATFSNAAQRNIVYLSGTTDNAVFYTCPANTVAYVLVATTGNSAISVVRNRATAGGGGGTIGDETVLVFNNLSAYRANKYAAQASLTGVVGTDEILILSPGDRLRTGGLGDYVITIEEES